MASLNALKKASKRSREPEAEAKVEPRHPFFKYVKPLFSEEEMAMIASLKAETERYAKYAPADWIVQVLKDEDAITMSALEDGLDPYDAGIEHWLAAIDVGKLLEERSELRSRATDLAHLLDEYGLTQMHSANHYISCAMDPQLSYKENVFRLKEVVSEFQSALNERRAVCLCKEVPCCCK